jgi:hypothetical protein
MKMQRFFGVILLASLLMTLGLVIVITMPFNASAQGGGVVYVEVEEQPGKDFNISGQATAPIIIDHTCTDLSKIPDYWLDEAKKLSFRQISG